MNMFKGQVMEEQPVGVASACLCPFSAAGIRVPVCCVFLQLPLDGRIINPPWDEEWGGNQSSQRSRPSGV